MSNTINFALELLLSHYLYVGFIGNNLGYHEICVRGKLNNEHLISFQSSGPGGKYYWKILVFYFCYHVIVCVL